MKRWIYLLVMTLIGFFIALDWLSACINLGQGGAQGFEVPGFFVRLVITGLFVAFLLRRKTPL
ncbi:MAG: hypothetical protein LBJ62_03145 [Bifidobacteriaceae bacterium]|jgi:hypothetical protein|nr:hypothetical protein [Bifidobacteriaceae bacterium]